ncbi:MAG: DHH family phosphoesterase [Flavobacteriales bacterium]|jgi:phosphoesterase RecJ-like protein|tara:strand:+ start:846 stop:1865 length:1020 start_codon:yes stop_codon:yes gene_type:complete
MKIENIKVLKTLLSESRDLIIIPHTNPDGDAIGSCLALSHILKKNGHNASVISPNKPPHFLHWSPGFNDILYFDSEPENCQKKIEKSTLIFTLDFNDLNRIGELGDFVKSSGSKKIMIDHHRDPKKYADLMFSKPEIGSTCELLYEIIFSLGYEKSITRDISTCIYLGIMTDTGSFQYSSVTSRTHQIVSQLIDKGINQNEIHNKVYNDSSSSRLKVLGSALSNLNLLESLKTAYMFLKRNDLDKFDYQKGDSEGIVNYGLSLKNVLFSVIFIEDINDKNNVKISFRSQGEFSCNEFAEEHFNGGGHINAAGGRNNGNAEDAINKFLKILPNYKEKLIN